MLRSTVSRGWRPSRIAAFSDGSPNESNPNGWRTRIAVPAPEVGRDVADRVDEHVAHVQVAGRVGKLLEHVALGPRVRLAGIRDREGLLAFPDALPLRLDRLRVVSLGLGSPHPVTWLGVQKSLSRERPGEAAAAGPRSLPALRKKLLHWPRMLALFPETARVEDGELTVRRSSRRARWRERFGTPLVVYCERSLRERARLFRARRARGARRLRNEGVRERRAAAAARRRRGSAQTSRRSVSSRSRGRLGSKADRSSSTATTSRTRSCERRRRRVRSSCSTRSTSPSGLRRPESGGRLCA